MISLLKDILFLYMSLHFFNTVDDLVRSSNFPLPSIKSLFEIQVIREFLHTVYHSYSLYKNNLTPLVTSVNFPEYPI